VAPPSLRLIAAREHTAGDLAADPPGGADPAVVNAPPSARTIERVTPVRRRSV
jgi:hypothetical protein